MTGYPGLEALCRFPLKAPIQLLYVIYSAVPFAIGFVLSLKLQGISSLCFLISMICSSRARSE